jgi:hypothetical protein
MIMSSAMDNQADIVALSFQCIRGFEHLIHSLKIGSEDLHQHMPSITVENNFARFKDWCGNLGALQRGISSLDARLRDSTVMRDTVLRFLAQLQESVESSTSDDHPARDK